MWKGVQLNSLKTQFSWMDTFENYFRAVWGVIKKRSTCTSFVHSLFNKKYDEILNLTCHPFKIISMYYNFRLFLFKKTVKTTSDPKHEWRSKGQSVDYGPVGIDLNVSRSFASEIRSLFYQGWSRMEKCCHFNSIMLWWGCFICNGNDPHASRGM